MLAHSTFATLAFTRIILAAANSRQSPGRVRNRFLGDVAATTWATVNVTNGCVAILLHDALQILPRMTQNCGLTFPHQRRTPPRAPAVRWRGPVGQQLLLDRSRQNVRVMRRTVPLRRRRGAPPFKEFASSVYAHLIVVVRNRS